MIHQRLIKSCANALFARGVLFVALIQFLLLAPTNSHAHGPFDNSIRATLHSDALEVSVVLGGEAAVEILKRSSPGKSVALGGMGLKTLPNELATFFIEIKSGATMLVANKFTVVGDGLEYSFTATYPKPAGNSLTFRAPYFDASEQMKPGTLVLTDDTGRQIGSGLLTKGSTTVELTLLQQPASTIATTEVETRPTTTPPTIAAATSAASAATPLPRSNLPFVLIALIGLLALGGLWLVRRLLSKPVENNL